MIAIKIKSDSTLIIKVKKKINKVDFERISLYIESIIDSNFQSIILFKVKSKQKEEIKIVIEEYCNNLPYNYQIK